MAARQRRTTQGLAVLLALATTTLVGCSGKSAARPSATTASPTAAVSTSAGDSTTESSSASPATTFAGPALKLSDISIRVVNLYAPIAGESGPPAPGPALDIYDVQLTGQAATPVATNVAYGSASPYFLVHEPANSFGHPAVEMYALPTGDDPKTQQADAKGIGGVADDGSHAQITWVLTADNGGLSLGGPLGRLSFADRVEKGDDGNGTKAPVAPAAAAGQGEILVDASAVNGLNLSLYLLIDHACAPPINGDPSVKGLPYVYNGTIAGANTSFAIFTTTPGTHQVSVVNASGTQPTCAQLTAKQGTTSVDVAAGQQVEVYVYGTSAKDLHLALAPLRS